MIVINYSLISLDLGLRLVTCELGRIWSQSLLNAAPEGDICLVPFMWPVPACPQGCAHPVLLLHACPESPIYIIHLPFDFASPTFTRIETMSVCLCFTDHNIHSTEHSKEQELNVWF